MTTLVSNLQPFLNICTEYTHKYRFTFTVDETKPDKTAFMIFNTTPSVRDYLLRDRITLQNKAVPIVSHYKYLGLEIVEGHGDFRWDRHVNSLITKARLKSQFLLYKLRRNKGLIPRLAIPLCNSTVRPIFEFAAQIWSGNLPQNLINKKS